MENENNGGLGRDGFSSQDGQSQNYDSQPGRNANEGIGITGNNRSQNEDNNASGRDSEDFTSQYSDTNSNFEETENDAYDTNLTDSDELEDDEDFEEDEEDEEDEDFDEDDELENDEEAETDDFRNSGI